MARICFAAMLQRYLSCPALDVRADTVRAALEQTVAVQPALRGYLFDDQGRLRRHVTVFVDAQPIADRDGLADAVRPESEIYVMQALSGG